MKKSLRRTVWQWMGSHKWLIVIIVAAMIVGGYTLWSTMSWRQYQKQYEVALVDTKTRIDTVLSLPQKTSEEKQQKIMSLTEEGNKEAVINCQMSNLFDWQKVFGDIQTKVDDCADRAEKLSTLRRALKNVALYLRDEQALMAKMLGATTPKQVREEDFEAQIARWQQIRSDVASMIVSETFVPVKTKAQEAASGIYDAWRRLFDAHKAKDQSVYEEARTKLPESYDRLAGIAPAADSPLLELSKVLQVAYSALYS